MNDTERPAFTQNNQIAWTLLKLMDNKLQTVSIQDVAVLLALDDCPSDHCIFHLDLAVTRDPCDASLQEVT